MMKVIIEVTIEMDTMLTTPLALLTFNLENLVTDFEKKVEEDENYVGPLTGSVVFDGEITASVRRADNEYG